MNVERVSFYDRAAVMTDDASAAIIAHGANSLIRTHERGRLVSRTERSTREAEIDARFHAVSHRYGDRFDAAAEKKIRDDIGRLVDAALTLRRWTVANSDEPDFAFSPERRDG